VRNHRGVLDHSVTLATGVEILNSMRVIPNGSESDVLFTLFQRPGTVAAQVVREHGACRVLTNLGAYQDSKHLHFHVSAGEPLR
jgi:hypothetical protein